MRKTSEDHSEVISQVLFGEQVTCLQESQSKTLIQTSDGYQGWIHSIALIPDFYQANMTTSRLVIPVYDRKSILFAPIFHLPFGVSVKVIDKEEDWNTIELPGKEICYIRSGNLVDKISLTRISHTISREGMQDDASDCRDSPKEGEKYGLKDLYAFTTQFLGIPYCWGGRSSFGFDCSGFSQMIYRYIGFLIERDSSDQVKDSRFKEISAPNIGDLIFWGQSIDKINHVGISLGNEQFIHVSVKEQQPWVRISSLHDAAWDCKAGSAYPFRVFKTLS